MELSDSFVSSTKLWFLAKKYAKIEKVALTLRVANKKLHPYFQAHIINVLMNQPI